MRLVLRLQLNNFKLPFPSVRLFFFILIILTSIFNSITSFAYSPQEGNINALLGFHTYRTIFRDEDDGAKSRWMMSPALIAQGDIDEKSTLEVSISGLNKVYFRRVGGDILAEQRSLLDIAMGYRRWFSKYWSWGITFFSTYPIGDYFTAHPLDAGIAPQPTTAQVVTPYGFHFSLQYEAWSYKKMGIVVDARYSSLVTAKLREDAEHFGVMLLFRYLVQGREEPPSAPAKADPPTNSIPTPNSSEPIAQPLR